MIMLHAQFTDAIIVINLNELARNDSLFEHLNAHSSKNKRDKEF